MFKSKWDTISLISDKNIYIVLFLFAFIFILLRALFIPLFVDEIVTYTHYVKNEYFSPYNDLKKANNHIINTLLTYVSYSFFGNSPFSLRLFNVIAFIPYVIFVYKIGLFFRHRLVKWTFYLASLFTLNLIVYFALSRGYGLSFTFCLASIYYLIQVTKRTIIWDVLLAVISLFLALYSNFSLLLFISISGLILLINAVKKHKFYFQKKYILVTLISLAIFVISLIDSISILFYYKEHGLLWWGDLKGFWHTTVKTLIHHLFNSWDKYFFLQTLVVISTGFIIIRYLWKSRFSFKNLYFYIFILNVIGIILMGLLFDVNYPYQRTGLHLYVFFIGAFCFAIDSIESRKFIPFLLIPLFLVPFHFVKDFNLNHIVDWEEDNLPEEFFEKIKEIESKEEKNYIPSIHIHGTAKVCWNYKITNNYLSYMPNCCSGNDTENIYNDYVVFRKNDFQNQIQFYDSIAGQATSKMVLYKRKKPAERKLLYENKVKEKISLNKEFYEFIRFGIDSNETSALNMELMAALEYHKQPFRADLIVSVENRKTRKTVTSKVINLFTKEDWVIEEPISLGCYIDGLPIGEELVVIIYLWNLKEVTYTIHESEVKLNRIINFDFDKGKNYSIGY